VVYVRYMCGEMCPMIPEWTQPTNRFHAEFDSPTIIAAAPTCSGCSGGFFVVEAAKHGVRGISSDGDVTTQCGMQSGGSQDGVGT
jgi:hypothetical protein